MCISHQVAIGDSTPIVFSLVDASAMRKRLVKSPSLQQEMKTCLHGRLEVE